MNKVCNSKQDRNQISSKMVLHSLKIIKVVDRNVTLSLFVKHNNFVINIHVRIKLRRFEQSSQQ